MRLIKREDVIVILKLIAIGGLALSIHALMGPSKEKEMAIKAYKHVHSSKRGLND